MVEDFVSKEDKLDFSWIKDAISNNSDYVVDVEVQDEFDAWVAVEDYIKMILAVFDYLHNIKIEYNVK